MATPTQDVLTRVSTDATAKFIETYYAALQNARSSLASFYVPTSSMPDGKSLPSITFNGNVLPDATALQSLFERQMPSAHYEVQCYDCHVLNANYPRAVDAPAAATTAAAAAGKNISILVSTNGYVRFGEARDGKMRGFSESVVLVPNEEAQLVQGARYQVRSHAGARRDWVIQSQNFRLVV
ncbi:MAG: hypothetical protein M1838_000920 [Thelocarpon superellum]|nr:MAG: hypothetical protein M1838_000920 [Thelocarpon superellum]